jgi:hypothetical protein
MPEKQSDKFKQAARELGADNDPAAFDKRMKKLKLTTKPATKKTSKAKGQ